MSRVTIFRAVGATDGAALNLVFQRMHRMTMTFQRRHLCCLKENKEARTPQTHRGLSNRQKFFDKKAKSGRKERRT